MGRLVEGWICLVVGSMAIALSQENLGFTSFFLLVGLIMIVLGLGLVALGLRDMTEAGSAEQTEPSSQPQSPS